MKYLFNVMLKSKMLQTCFVLLSACSSNGAMSICPSATTPLQVATQILQPSCTGQVGLLTILAQGGTPPYLYQANGNYISPSSNLFAGVYTITVSDASFNSIRTNITIIKPTPLNFQYCLLPPACQACLTPVSINPAGGTPPYTLFANAQQGNSPFLLPIGTYTISVQDANACSASAIIKISKPSNTGTITSIKQFANSSYNNMSNKHHSCSIVESSQAFESIYPNPCQDVLFIKPNSQNKTSPSFNIIDATGRVMYSNNNTPNQQYEVQTIQWPPGLYFLIIYNEQTSFLYKQILKR